MPSDISYARPYETGWSSAQLPAAQAFWDWHDALAAAPEFPDARIQAAYEQAQAGEPLRMVSREVSRAAYQACDRHNLNRDYLAAQVRALPQHQPPTRFDTGADLERFLDRWIVPHGRLLSGLVPGLETLKRATDHLSRGFFYTGTVLQLPAHLEANRLYLPQDDLRHEDLSMWTLRQGTVTEPVRKVLWKQMIRARDALARGHTALARLTWRAKWRLKFWWIGALELLNEVERRDFDVWSAPITLNRWRTAQVYLQTYIGRATARMS
jgi:phytoene synthase